MLFVYFNSKKELSRPFELYNFRKNELRKNIVHFLSTPESERVKDPTDATSRRNLNTTQKPLELMRWIVSHWSKDNELVLDLCAGTGFEKF